MRPKKSEKHAALAASQGLSKTRIDGEYDEHEQHDGHELHDEHEQHDGHEQHELHAIKRRERRCETPEGW